MMILTKIVSSLEKCFLDDAIDAYHSLHRISMLKNERLSVQLLYTSDALHPAQVDLLRLRIDHPDALKVSARTVEQVPVRMPCPQPPPDDNYLRTAPGLYPDVLQPLHYHGKLPILRGQLQSVWIELEASERLTAGDYRITVSLSDDSDTPVAVQTLELEVINALLPPQELHFTQWFHCDTLANYYHCEVWSERHWEIIEQFARTAARNGINMLLTPIHTPPLDTEVGGERLTVQLIDVTRNDGVYSFGFERLDRWIDLCDRVGIRYLEMAHFFTQWGAMHAPKIMATVDGTYRKLFGWETNATEETYVQYLQALIPALLEHLRRRGDDKRCFFHISDEPNEEQLASYSAAKSIVSELLRGYPIMDAISDFEFWKHGLVEMPIPVNDHIEPFLQADVHGLWTYYCCGQCKDVSNRLIAMPLWRTRSIGMQLYKYDIEGFLHWGFNYYNDRYSIDSINPYIEQSGDLWVPAGDTHSVYPAQDGTALESIRLISFFEALQDVRAMKLAETICGKAALVAEMERIFGGEIRFDRCAHDAQTLLNIREAVNAIIKSHVTEQA